MPRVTLSDRTRFYAHENVTLSRYNIIIIMLFFSALIKRFSRKRFCPHVFAFQLLQTYIYATEYMEGLDVVDQRLCVIRNNVVCNV